MLHRSLRVVALLASLSVLCLQALAALSQETQARVDAVGTQAIAAKQTAGLVIAVAQGQEIVFARGYGQANLELNVPVAADSVFRVGSVTKQFAAASILLLVEQGKLSLEDKLSKFFPEFPGGSGVTLRQLLNHTSGIRSFTAPLPDEIARVGISVPDMVKHIAGLGYIFSPGTDWSYSNSGYFLLGAIVEQISGQSFREFARQRLFEPNGMTDTALDKNEEIARGRVAGYRLDPDRPGQFLNASYTAMTVPHAAGAIRSTAADLIKWTVALHGGKVLKPASLKDMTTPVKLPPVQPPRRYKDTYGLGLSSGEYEGRKWIGHGGSIDGFESRLQYYPESRTTVVVLVNTDGGMKDLDAQVIKALFTEPR